MIEKAFSQLYPNKPFPYQAEIKYSKRFTPFNANIRKQGNKLTLNASANWKDVGEEIQLGLIQTLLMKLFGEKRETLQTQLYINFIRNVSDYTPSTQVDPILKVLFDELNQEYFNGEMEDCNLKWGKESTRQLGLYNYHNDTITISSIFVNHYDVVKFILYHELLHKQEKFNHKNGRSHHHTSRFRMLEKSYKDYDAMERKIENLVRESRRVKPKKFSFFGR